MFSSSRGFHEEDGDTVKGEIKTALNLVRVSVPLNVVSQGTGLDVSFVIELIDNPSIDLDTALSLYSEWKSRGVFTSRVFSEDVIAESSIQTALTLICMSVPLNVVSHGTGLDISLVTELSVNPNIYHGLVLALYHKWKESKQGL
jgi:hypothetical protein